MSTAMAARLRSVLQGRGPVLAEARALYEDVHAHPELSGRERRTAGLLTAWLARDGLRVERGIGGHGVAGVLRNGPGPLVMLRAELDALPVAERTGLPYASTVTAAGPGGDPVPVMHACGHDLHLAAAAGAARLLAAARGSWCGSLLVVGQPAEEILEGARAMLDDGLLDRFGRPDVALAQHTAPLPAGMVAHGAGPVTAGSRTVEVVIHGRGGHAATAHLGVDPVVTAAAVILRLQTIVAREVAAAEPVVVHVGSVRAGVHSSVMPDRAVLGLTLRAFDESTLDRVGRAVERIVRAECEASGRVRPPEVRVVGRSPATVPDPEVTAATRAAHETLLGRARVAAWPPSMAAEDFGHFAAAGVPTAYWMLGCVGRPQWEAAGSSDGSSDGPSDGPAGAASAARRLAALPANHSAEFAPDATRALPVGAAAMVAAALAHLPAPGGD